MHYETMKCKKKILIGRYNLLVNTSIVNIHVSEGVTIGWVYLSRLASWPCSATVEYRYHLTIEKWQSMGCYLCDGKGLVNIKCSVWLKYCIVSWNPSWHHFCYDGKLDLVNPSLTARVYTEGLAADRPVREMYCSLWWFNFSGTLDGNMLLNKFFQLWLWSGYLKHHNALLFALSDV